MGTPATAPSLQLRPKSLAEAIVEVLQREIIAGTFVPGQRLVERELIGRFGVSSIPVREALQELEDRGLVTRRHNRGCSVIELSPTELSRIAELRSALEPQVMKWAAERVTPDTVERLEAQLERVGAAAAERDLATFFQEDIVFHRMIWEAADNTFATRALETVLGSLFASGIIRSQSGQSINLTREVEKHRRLLNAIRRHDGERAAALLLDIAGGFEKHLPADGGPAD